MMEIQYNMWCTFSAPASLLSVSEPCKFASQGAIKSPFEPQWAPTCHFHNSQHFYEPISERFWAPVILFKPQWALMSANRTLLSSFLEPVYVFRGIGVWAQNNDSSASYNPSWLHRFFISVHLARYCDEWRVTYLSIVSSSKWSL